MTQAAATATRAGPQEERTILLADSDQERRGALAEALSRLPGASVVTLESQAALEDSLFTTPASLVITSARVDTTSSLHTLARARAVGFSVPFIVYTGLAAGALRVLVNGGDGTVLSSRVVDLKNFADLAAVMLRG